MEESGPGADLKLTERLQLLQKWQEEQRLKILEQHLQYESLQQEQEKIQHVLTNKPAGENYRVTDLRQHLSFLPKVPIPATPRFPTSATPRFPAASTPKYPMPSTPRTPSVRASGSPWTQTAPKQVFQKENVPPRKSSTVTGPNSKPEPPPTMSFVTATIQGVRKLSKYKERCPMMFEIIGHLDSAVSGNTGKKKFQLRDQSSSITCCFYEIDRELPRVIRGPQWYRCVGKLNKDDFHCVSIRPALAQEMQLFRTFEEASNQTMQVKLGLDQQ